MKAYPLLTLNTPTYLLTTEALRPPDEEPYDITSMANSRFFRSIPARSVEHRHLCIVGKMGSGKTTTKNFLASYALDRYGGVDNVNIVYTDDPRVAIELIDDRPVQLLIIDDATSYASSREIHKQAQFLKDFNRTRHAYMNRFPGRSALILHIFGWQRWIELDPGLRDGHLIIFKTGMTGRNDVRNIEDIIGPKYFDVLFRIWDAIDQGNDNAKSISVARISSRQPEEGGAGIYITEEVPWVLPDLLPSEKYFAADRQTEDEILYKYRSDPKWALRIECYDLDITNDHTQTEIADILSDRHGKTIRQGYVSEAISKVKELLKK